MTSRQKVVQKKSKQPARVSSLMMALEPRIMFDAALGAAVNAAHALPDAHAQSLIPVEPAAVEVRAGNPSQDNGKVEVVFVDTSVANYKSLEAGIPSGVQIVEFGGGNHGMAQIANWAQSNTGYDAIHIMSHGSEGSVRVGVDTLDDTALLTSAVTKAELADIGHALKAGGELHIHGCDGVDEGGGVNGQKFSSDLGSDSGATIKTHVAPTETVTVSSMTKDSGSSATDFITNDGSATRTVTGTVSVALTAKEVVQVSFDGGTTWVNAATTGTAWTVTDSSAHSANWTIEARVHNTDSCLSGAVASQAVTYDNFIATPFVTLTQDTTDGVVVNGSTDAMSSNGALTITAAASDVTRSFTVDGGASTSSYTIPTAQGSHTVIVTDTDVAGNTVSTRYTFILDTLAPALSAAVVNGNSLVLSYTEAGVGMSTVTPAVTDFSVSVNGGTSVNPASVTVDTVNQTVTLALASGVLSTDAVSVSYHPGSNKIEDIAGNLAACFDNQTVTNNTPPTETLTITSMTKDSGASSTDFVTNDGTAGRTVTGTVSATLGKNEVVQVSFDGGTTWSTASVTGNTWTVQDNGAHNSNWTIEAQVVNTVTGDTGAAASQGVNYDGAAIATPTVTLVTDTTDGVSNNNTDNITSNANLNISAPNSADGSDDLARVITVTDSNGNVTTSSTYTPPAVDGKYTVVVTDTDIAGNTASATYSFTLETTKPVLNTATVSANTLTLSYAEAGTMSTVTPANTDFTVTANGNTVNVTGVTVDTVNQTVTLTLANGGVLSSDSVAVTYHPTANGIEDIAGNLAAGFDAQAVKNNTVPTEHIQIVAMTNDSAAADFITNDGSANRTVTGTISAALNPSEVLQVTVDGGATWVNATVNNDLTWTVTDSNSHSANWSIEARVVNTDTNQHGDRACQAVIYDVGGITPPNISLVSDSTDGVLTHGTDNITNNPALNISAPADANGDAITRVVTVDGVVIADPANYTVADGAHTVVVTDTDVAGNSATTTYKYTLDTVAPALTSATVNGNSLVLAYAESGTGMSTVTPVASDYAVTVNGNVVTPTSVTVDSVNQTVTLTLADGTHTGDVVSVSYTQNTQTGQGIEDIAGNHAANLESQGVNNVTAPQTISITAASNDNGTNNVAGTLNAPLTANEGVQISTDGGKTWVDAVVNGTSWTAQTGVVVNAGVTDLARIVDTITEATVAQDTATIADPTVTVAIVSMTNDSGAADFITNDGSANRTVTGTISAALASNEVVQVSFDGGTTWTTTATVDGTNWTATDTGAHSSNWTIEARVHNTSSDLSGDTASQAVIYDAAGGLTPPNISLVSDSTDGASGHSADHVTNNPALNISAPADTNGDAVTRVVTVDGVVIADPANYTVADGAHTVVVTDTDVAGNSASTTFNYTLDTVAPVLNSASVNGNTVTLRYNETGSGMSSVTPSTSDYSVSVNGGTAFNPASVSVDPTTHAVTLTLANGVLITDNVSVAYTPGNAPIEDIAGNTAASFNAENIANYTGEVAPTETISIVSMSKDSGTSATDFLTNDGSAGRTVTGTLSSALLPNEMLQVSFDGGATWTTTATVDGTNWTASDNGAHNGNWTIEARVSTKDQLFTGPVATQDVTLDSGIPAPIVTLANDTTDGVVTNGSGDLLTSSAALTVSSGADADGVQDVITRTYSVDGATATGSYTAPTTDGSHTVVVTETDSAGNTASTSLTFTLDTTAPALKSATVNGNSLVLAYTETGTGMSTVTPAASDFAVTVNGTVVTPTSVTVDTVNQTVTLTLADGTHTGDAVSVSYTQNISGQGIEDVVGNHAANLEGQGVNNITAPQTITITAASNDTGTNNVAGTLNAPLTANEGVQISTDGGITWIDATVNGTTWTAHTGVGVNAGVTDLARIVDTVTTKTVAEDTATIAAPTETITIVSMTKDTGTSTSDFLTNDGSANRTVTGTLSAVLAPNEVVQVSFDGGTTWTTTATVNGTDWTATDSGVHGGNWTIEARVHSTSSDLTGATATQNVTLDTVIATPTIALTTDTTDGVTNHGTDVLTSNPALTFSAPANDVTRSITVDGGAASATYTAPSGQGSHTVTVTDTDAAGNTVSTSYTFTLDTIAPALSTATINGASLVLTYTEAGTGMSTVTPAVTDFAVTVNGGAAQNPTSVVVDTANGTVTLTMANGVIVTDAVTVSYTPGANAIEDIVGNAAAALEGHAVQNITGAVAPSETVTIVSMGKDTGASSADFITNDGSANRTVSGTISAPLATYEAVQVSFDGGKTWTLATTDGTNWTVNDGGVHSANWDIQARVVNTVTTLHGAAADQAVTLDTVIAAPTITLTTDTTDGVTGNGTDIKSSNGALTISAAASDVTRSITVDGGAASATYTAPTGQGSHTVVVTDTDTAGNTVSTSYTFTLDTVAPTLSKATVNGNTLVLSYTETGTGMSSVTPSAADYSVSVNNIAVTPASVTVDTVNKTVTLTLVNGVHTSDTVLVSYTQGSNKIEDIVGNLADNLVGHAVTNDTPVQTIKITNAVDVSGVNTVTAVINAPLTPNEKVQISTDGGVTWVDAVPVAGTNGTTFTANLPTTGTNGVTDLARIVDTVSKQSVATDTATVTGVTVDNVTPTSSGGHTSAPVSPDQAVQVSNDGGTTWVPAKQTSPTTWTAPVGGDNTTVIARIVNTITGQTVSNDNKTVANVPLQVVRPVAPNVPAPVHAMEAPTDSPILELASTWTMPVSEGAHQYTNPITDDALLVANPPGAMLAVSGKDATFQLPAGVFKDTDPAAKTTIEATLADGSPLPSWLKFDASSGKFTGKPPAGKEQNLQIKLTATDDQGRKATTDFTIKVLKATTDKATQGPSASVEGSRLHNQVLASLGRPSLGQQMEHFGKAGQQKDHETLVKHLEKVA